MFNQNNITALIADINAGFEEQRNTIKETVQQLIPFKIMEYAGAQKFAGHMTTLAQLHHFTISDEVVNVIYDALEETLFGTEMSQYAQHIRVMTKSVIKEEIELVADEMVRNFVCLLIEQQLAHFPVSCDNFFVPLLKKKTMKELNNLSSLLREFEENEITDSISYDDACNANLILNRKFILK